MIELPQRDYRRFPGSAYGDQLAAARYCGLNAPPQHIDGEWQHGWLGTERNFHPEIAVGGDGGSFARRAKSRFFVAREDQAEYLRSAGYARVYAIGLPIVYVARPVLPRIAGSLLVLPIHSLPDTNEDWDAGAYAGYVGSIARQFSQVYVCLHQSCVDKGNWTDPFKALGIPVVGGADEADQASLHRMAQLFSQFEFVTTNGFGSHVPYASYFGCKVSVCGPRPRWRRSDYEKLHFYRNAPDVLDVMEKWAQTDHLAKLYPQFVRAPLEAEPQREWAAWQLGEQCKLRPHELKTLFGWDLAGRARHAARMFHAMALGAHRIVHRGWLLLASIGLPGLVAAFQIAAARRTKQGVSRVWCGWRRRLTLRNGSTDIDVFEQHFARREILDIPLPAHVSRILDLGANVGVSVEIFRRRCPRARIVAVELEARNADLCRANHAADALVTVVNGAVWSEAGTVGVKDVNDGDWAYRADPAAGAAGVRALTYAQLLAAYDLPSVDVMKMDIEGAEAAVLEASWQDIFRTTAVSIIEIHDWIEGIEARMRRVIADAAKQFDLEVSRSGEFWVVRNRALLVR